MTFLHIKHSCLDVLSLKWWRPFNTFLKKYLEDISPFCRVTDTPVLDFWWHLLWISKPEWAPLFTLGNGICVTVPWDSPSGVTPANLLAASMAAKLMSLPHTCDQVLVGLEWETYHATGEHSTNWAMLAQLDLLTLKTFSHEPKPISGSVQHVQM